MSIWDFFVKKLISTVCYKRAENIYWTPDTGSFSLSFVRKQNDRCYNREQFERRSRSWKEHTSPKKFRGRKSMASVREWPLKTAARSLQDVAQKAEKLWRINWAIVWQLVSRRFGSVPRPILSGFFKWSETGRTRPRRVCMWSLFLISVSVGKTEWKLFP